MPNPPRTALVAAALLAVYLVWGSTYVAIRIAVQTLPPFLLACVRFLVAGALLYAWTIGRGGRAPADGAADRDAPPSPSDPIGPRQWAAATLVGGLLLLGGNGLVVWGEQTVPSGLAALIVATVPLWMALLGRVLLGQRMARLSVVGVLLGFAGVAVLLSPAGDGGADPAGTAVICLAALSWGLGSVWSRRLPLPRRPAVATALEMLGGGALLTTVAAVGGEFGRVDLGAVTLASWAALAYLVVFGSLVAFSAYVWLLANVRSDLASTYAYVNPLVAVLLGWALLGETVTARTLLGGAVIVVAVGLVLAGRRQPGEAAPGAGRRLPPDVTLWRVSRRRPRSPGPAPRTPRPRCSPGGWGCC